MDHDQLIREVLRLRAHVKLMHGRLCRAGREDVPRVCDGKEQDAFEEWAQSQGFEMSQHTLHWLFLDSKTNAARKGWKAAIEYCLRRLSPQSGGSDGT